MLPVIVVLCWIWKGGIYYYFTIASLIKRAGDTSRYFQIPKQDRYKYPINPFKNPVTRIFIAIVGPYIFALFGCLSLLFPMPLPPEILHVFVVIATVIDIISFFLRKHWIAKGQYTNIITLDVILHNIPLEEDEKEVKDD